VGKASSKTKRKTRKSSAKRGNVQAAYSPFEEKLTDVFSAFAPLKCSDQCTEQEIEKVRGKVGGAIPEILESYYRLAGNSWVNSAYQRLVPSEEIVVVDRGIVFAEECQRIVAWGISSQDLGEPDPPVLQVDAKNKVWYSDSKRLSSFLLKFACWQAVGGVMPYIRRYEVSDGARKRISARLRRADLDSPDYSHPLRAYYLPGLVACLWNTGKKQTAFVGTTQSQQLTQFEKDLL
jgi:hypothetical protein